MKKNSLALAFILLILTLLASSTLDICNSGFGQQVVNDLSMFQHDPARTGTKLWNFSIGAGISSSPADLNSMVYLGSWNYNVYPIGSETTPEATLNQAPTPRPALTLAQAPKPPVSIDMS